MISNDLRASVIIVGYNSLEDLSRCLPSLLPGLGSHDEVIVVDNASTDGSSGWLEQSFPQINLIKSPVNLGFAGGNNLGARNARGKYLAFLNPDTQVEKAWLDALVAALENDNTAGLATAKILLLNDPDRINTCGNDVHISGITLCRGMGHPREDFANPEEVSAVSGAAFVIRKELFDSLDGFDESFFLYMEDTDLSWRARLAGYRCLYVPTSVVYHEYRLIFGPVKTFYQERNRYLMLLKCLHCHTLLALLPALLLAEVVAWGFTFLQDRRNFTNKIKAYVWVASNLDAIRQSRRRVQAHRCLGDRQLLITTNHLLRYEQATTGLLSRIAHALFDPGFYIFRQFALAVQ